MSNEEKDVKPNGIGALKSVIKNNQRKRIENGEIVIYKNGIAHLVSPSYSAISLPVLKTFLKNSGINGLLD